MNRNILFTDTVELLLNDLTRYENRITDPGISQDDITSVRFEILENTLERIFNVLDENEEQHKNRNSAFQLGWITATAGRYLFTKGRYKVSESFIRFLKETVFKCHLCDNGFGYSLEKGLYKGSGITNSFVKKYPDFRDIYNGKPKDYYGTQYDVDCIFITYSFSSFLLKMEETNNYDNPVEKTRLKTMCTDFEEFLSYGKDIQGKYRAEGEELYRRAKRTWPALAYSVAEVYGMYDERYRIARAYTLYPEITPMRTREAKRHEKKKSQSKSIGSLIITCVVLTILSTVISQMYVFFSGHPERQGWAVLISLFALIFIYFASFPIVGLLFWGDSKLSR